MEKEFEPIEEYIYWIYSNIALAHSAVRNNHNKYSGIDYIIRSCIYKGLCTGSMSIGSLYDDEKVKLDTSAYCHCGTEGALSLSHLISRKHGGSDSGANIVYACEKC